MDLYLANYKTFPEFDCLSLLFRICLLDSFCYRTLFGTYIHDNLLHMISPQDIEALQNLKVPIPKKEHKRINILRQCDLLDTPSEESYDRFTSLASRHFKVLKNYSPFNFI